MATVLNRPPFASHLTALKSEGGQHVLHHTSTWLRCVRENAYLILTSVAHACFHVFPVHLARISSCSRAGKSKAMTYVKESVPPYCCLGPLRNDSI
jgi:hypothetical protein